jgi:hypothetical protein
MIGIDRPMRRRDLIALLALAVLPPQARAAEDKKKKSGGPGYIQLETLTGTTNKASGRRGVLTVDCGLQIDDDKLRDYAEKSLPRLRAAYVQVVQVYAAGLPSGSEPNAEFIVRELQRQTDMILKRRGARLLVGAIVAN